MHNQAIKVISIAGGKGGVGKTTLSINLAASLAKAHKKTLLFDADLSLANVDLLLGFHSKKNIKDVLMGRVRLHDICIEGPHGLKIIPGASGIQTLADMGSEQVASLIHAFSEITDDLDVMIVDIAAGISKQVINLTNASQDIIMVLCNEPSSFADAYAMMKILNQQHARARFGVVINKVRNGSEAEQVFIKFQAAATRFLDLNLQYLGCVPQDDHVALAAREKKALIDAYPNSHAARAIAHLGTRIMEWNDETLIQGGIQYFVERMIQGQSVAVCV